MDKKALEAFSRKAAKSIKTESDLDYFRKMLTKVTVETALNAELDDHLGYEKHATKLSSTPVMATHLSRFSLMMARFLLMCRATEMRPLNPSWFVSTRLDFSPRPRPNMKPC